MTQANFISEEYKSLNTKLHSDSEEYGNRNNYLCDQLPTSISIIHKLFNCMSVLDYGCGKGMIVRSLRNKLAKHPITIQGYDPCVKEYEKIPDPADILISTDVLEHIEPDKINEVLGHIGHLTHRSCYLVIDLLPAVKTLPDGRNAHIMLATSGWWLNKLSKIFKSGIHYIVEREANAKTRMGPTKKLIFVGAKREEDILIALNLFSTTHANIHHKKTKILGHMSQQET